MQCLLPLLLVAKVCSFSHAQAKSVFRSHMLQMSRAQQGGADNKVSVIGLAGSVAETIAIKLSERGASVTAVLDRQPTSPVLLEKMKNKKLDVMLFSGDFDAKMMASRTLVAVEDEGDEALRGGPGTDYKNKKKDQKSEVAPMMDKLVKALEPSLNSLICVAPAEPATGSGGLGNIFASRGPEAFKKWCTQNGKPFSLLQYGQLTGAVPGAEPIPMIGLPALEPELHPSYSLPGIVLSAVGTNKYASTEMCTRDSLAEATARCVVRGTPLETLVLSIAGEAPTEKEWNVLFNRFSSSSDAELLRVEFGSISKPTQLINWLTDQWFPQALIEADAAVTLSGARPVRATKVSDTAVQIKWEDLQPDMSVKMVGALEIRIQPVGADSATGQTPSLTVKRVGTSQGGVALPGEMQLLDKLVEGINKQVYKKQLATPLA